MPPKHKPGKNKLSNISSAFLEHSGFLKKFLKRFLSENHDIEDVVQETYLKAYRAEQEKDIDQPKAFLFSIAKNLALNELSKKSRQMTDSIEECTAALNLVDVATIENQVEAEQSLGIYCEAIASLPERRRRVYLLRKVHGLPHKEIAHRLGISISSVEKHLLKGALHCRNYIKNQRYDHGIGVVEGSATIIQKGWME